MNKTQNRNPSLDFIRSLAILMVCWVHSVNRIYSFTLKGMNSLSSASFVFGNVAHAFGQMGVPLFLMLSGYLLLSREYNSFEDVKAFLKKKLLPLLICYEIWVALYELFAVFVVKLKPFSLGQWVRHSLMLEEFKYLRHMWYIPAIIGIYLFIPLLSIVLHKLPAKAFVLPLLAGYFYFFLVPTLNIFLAPTGHTQLSSRINIAYMGAHNGMYVLFGYFFKTCLEPRLIRSDRKKILAVLFAVCSVVTAVLTGAVLCWSYRHNAAITVQYSNALLPIFGVSLFSAVTLMGDRIPFAGLWRSVSLASFGIFFFHYPILLWILDHFKTQLAEIKKPLGCLLLSGVIFLSAYAIVVILSHLLPGVSKILFLRKPETKKDKALSENLS
jgi:surface polysaccharide O-acyltransferase-like enzyme